MSYAKVSLEGLAKSRVQLSIIAFIDRLRYDDAGLFNTCWSFS